MTELNPDASANYARLLSRHINLADARLGAVTLAPSDEFFAPVERMLQAGDPQWRAGVYDAHGKWMDGWETRRRRGSGFDHCVVRLAAPCTLALLEIDTRYFTGNYPPFASVQACRVTGAPDDATVWADLLPRVSLEGNHRNFFELESTGIWTHLKLNIYPDGGVARLRAYGSVHRDWSSAGRDLVDLTAALNGGLALACSDEHYGSMHNLLLPGRGASMGDGWETRRRREPGYDWAILRLGRAGRIQSIEVDTAHFKGNFPHEVSVNATLLTGDASGNLSSESMYWPVLLEPRLLQADHVQKFSKELRDLGTVSHVRVNIHPDGGLSRVRLFGHPEPG
ncbi:MAG: allantoicase [Steroidobacteraceae bacterium]|jgi:allantoicase